MRPTIEMRDMDPDTTNTARLAAERLKAKEKLAAESPRSKKAFKLCYHTTEAMDSEKPPLWISQDNNNAHAMRLKFLKIYTRCDNFIERGKPHIRKSVTPPPPGGGSRSASPTMQIGGEREPADLSAAPYRVLPPRRYLSCLFSRNQHLNLVGNLPKDLNNLFLQLAKQDNGHLLPELLLLLNTVIPRNHTTTYGIHGGGTSYNFTDQQIAGVSAVPILDNFALALFKLSKQGRLSDVLGGHLDEIVAEIARVVIRVLAAESKGGVSVSQPEHARKCSYRFRPNVGSLEPKKAVLEVIWAADQAIARRPLDTGSDLEDENPATDTTSGETKGGEGDDNNKEESDSSELNLTPALSGLFPDKLAADASEIILGAIKQGGERMQDLCITWTALLSPSTSSPQVLGSIFRSRRADNGCSSMEPVAESAKKPSAAAARTTPCTTCKSNG